MDFLWVVGTIVILCWKLHKRYPGAVLLLFGVFCLPIIGCYLPMVFFGKNDLASQIGGTIGIFLEYPFIMTYIHFWWFVPPIKRRIIAEETEKIIQKKKWKVEFGTPQEYEIESIVSNRDYLVREYEKFMQMDVPSDNPFVNPESIWYYKTNKTIRSRAIDEWRRREQKKIDEERDAIEESCLAMIEGKRWFRKKNIPTESPTSYAKDLTFADIVRRRVRSIFPTNKQLAHFMSKHYVQGRNGAMETHSQQEWLDILSSDSEAFYNALSLWREECARRIIAAGKWPDGFYGYSDDLQKS